MSEENVETYRGVVEAWNSGDVDHILEFVCADVEVMSFLTVVEGGYHGHEGVRRYWNDFHEIFPDWHSEVLDVRAVRNEVTLARLQLRGRGANSSAPVDQVMWHVVHWRGGKAVRLSAYNAEAEALEAVGLSG
jgi:ketosteroid isomerase-like protein